MQNFHNPNANKMGNALKLLNFKPYKKYKIGVDFSPMAFEATALDRTVPMESKILTDFEQMCVFSTSLGKMDDLVHDLSMALEDAASHKRAKSDGDHGATSSGARQYPRKRRGHQKIHQPEIDNIGDTSESIDEALKHYMESCTHSDSGDLALAQHIVRLTMPLSVNYIPSHMESDSLNESIFSPVRPHRRRKKYKTMAIDPDPSSSQHEFPVLGKPKFNRHRSKIVKLKHCSMGSSPMDGSLHQFKDKSFDTVPGKRKRSTRSKFDFVGGSLHTSPEDCSSKDEDTMDSAMNSQEGSSSISSSSDTESRDDYGGTHEADDEQSDFFHESGPSCGIPGVIPWWENERVNSGDEIMVSDKQFQQILNGSFEHLSKLSQISFKARMTRTRKHCGREIRFERRKLKGKIPGSTVQRLIKKRHKWNSLQGKMSDWYANSNNNNSYTVTECKRGWKTPPLTEGQLEIIRTESEPIPDTDIANRMFQKMSWSPGHDLGVNGIGIQMPTKNTLIPRRQGLRCCENIGQLADVRLQGIEDSFSSEGVAAISAHLIS